ncbi:MAG: hypothetical protein H6R00_422 [Proteobacteria bacterium]|nr:hypothetical protein [Pseudomonadota bacterium]
MQGRGWQESSSFAGEVQTRQREEGKIKADGTPWVQSAGQALVCTLFWVARLRATIVPRGAAKLAAAGLFAALVAETGSFGRSGHERR